MSDADLDLAIAQTSRRAPNLAADAQDQNPDDAADNLRMAQATGVPSQVISLDQERFKQRYQQNLARQLVNNDPQLQDYINAHPLAAAVSGDDYDNLANVGKAQERTVKLFGGLRALGHALPEALSEGAGAFKEAWGGTPLGGAGYNPNDTDVNNAVRMAAQAPFDFAYRVFTGAMAGAGAAAPKFTKEFVEQDLLNAGVSPETAGGISQEAAAMTEWKLNEPEGLMVTGKTVARATEAGRQIALAQQFRQLETAVKPWVEAGVPVPAGVHPMVDQLYAAKNLELLRAMNDELAAAQASFTKTRSPEMFELFRSRNPALANTEIGISGPRVLELYGDQVPHPEDGLLGWVDGIQNKLDEIKDTGGDLRIKMSDYITKIDPALASQLTEDIRMWPNGVTAREAMDIDPQPKEVVDSPLAHARNQLGTEPQFSLGDRKLFLERMGEDPRLRMGEPTSDLGVPLKIWDAHDFALKLQDGTEVGTLNITRQNEGKRLYVDWIGGLGAWGPRDIGPSAMRDILRQLKREFPDAEELTGHRVSGARDVAESYDQPSAHPKVRLSLADRIRGKTAPEVEELPVIKLTDEAVGLPTDWEVIPENIAKFKAILDDGYWRSAGQGFVFNDPDIAKLPQEFQDLAKAVQDTAARIMGEGADVRAVSAIDHQKNGPDRITRGLHIGSGGGVSGKIPLILVDLFQGDAIGTTRHEAIHFLRNIGLITPGEWRSLTNHALEGGWIEKHGINDRYAHLDQAGQIEEAIAEEYRAWGKALDEGKAAEKDLTAIQRVFKKMRDWWEGVKRTYRDRTGKDVRPEDFFHYVETGVVSRGESAALPRAVGGAKEMAEEFPRLSEAEKDSLQTQIDILRASGTGLDARSFAIMQKAIRDRYAKDLERAQKRAEDQQKTMQTEQWKKDYREVYKETEERVRNRPDVLADLFFGSGELNGFKLDRKYRIATDTLTEEQRALVPKHYQAKDGLPADGLAHMFGFPDGNSMVTALAGYNKAKEGLTPQEMLAKITKEQAQAEMERRYGFLEKNIMEEARDQALSDADINIVAEEMQAAAMMHGTQPVIDLATAERRATTIVNNMKIGSTWLTPKGVAKSKILSADPFMNDVGRLSRMIERDLIAGKNDEAIVKMQQKLVSMLVAKRVAQVAKEVEKFDKVAKVYSAREKSGIEIQYLNYVHRVLQQIGKKVYRSAEDLQKEIEARRPHTERDFTDWVVGVNSSGRDMPIWPQLADDNWSKPYHDLTVEEFRAVRDSIKTMIHNGREEMKIIKAGEAADLADVLSEMITGLDKFDRIHYDYEGERYGLAGTPVAKAGRTFLAAHMKMETLLNRWDQYDPDGVWKQYIMRPLFEGANQEDIWRKDYSKRLLALDDGEDLTRTVANNLFRDPSEDGPAVFGPHTRMTRAGLRAVMLNMGTESNFTKLAKGYNLERDAIEAWVHAYATEKDWKFVKGVWDLFKDIKEKSDTMYRSMTGGVPSQDVPGRTVQTKFGDVEGGYYPLISHPVFESKFAQAAPPDALFNGYYTKAATPAGYMEQRTGAVYPLSLSLDSMPGRIAQMLHDIALRPAVVQASKVFYNSKIKEAIRTRYGKEYSDLLEPYLRDIANSRNYMSGAQQTFANFSEFVRQNMITTLVGLNPGTVMKHGPTAWIQSAQEVGYGKFTKEFTKMSLDFFGRSVRTLFGQDPKTAESEWKFAMDRSLELQRRDRNWQETLGGATNTLVEKGKWRNMRQTIIAYASKPVAFSDMVSAVPTWLAKYKEAIAEGRSEGDAVYLADFSVRRAHGSTSIVDRPAIMRGNGTMTGWLTSVYNFFNHIMNRQMEMIWKAGDTMKLVREEGMTAEARSEVMARGAELFAYVLWPAIVEEIVTPLPESKDERKHSWAKTAAKGLAYTLGASWVGVRDIVNAWLRGSDPSVGLATTAWKSVTDFGRDWGKKGPMNKDHAGRLIRDGAVLTGVATGVPGQQIGRIGQFVYDVSTGKERPKGPWAWLVGLRYGTTKNHSKTWEDWKAGKIK